jgi:hypothetical protein
MGFWVHGGRLAWEIPFLWFGPWRTSERDGMGWERWLRRRPPSLAHAFWITPVRLRLVYPVTRRPGVFRLLSHAHHIIGRFNHLNSTHPSILTPREYYRHIAFYSASSSPARAGIASHDLPAGPGDSTLADTLPSTFASAILVNGFMTNSKKGLYFRFFFYIPLL